MAEISAVVTSCGRFDLLNKMLESFYHFGGYADEIIIAEDSFDNKGQMVRIDEAYSKAKGDYIFHLEDDWEFLKPGFMDLSLDILENYPQIMQVWLMKPWDTPLDSEEYWAKGNPFQLVSTNFHGWHGFTLNPGLRRKSDYLKVAPYSQFGKTCLAEKAIGQRYYDFGYRGAILPDTYITHKGYGRHCECSLHQL